MAERRLNDVSVSQTGSASYMQYACLVLASSFSILRSVRSTIAFRTECRSNPAQS